MTYLPDIAWPGMHYHLYFNASYRIQIRFNSEISIALDANRVKPQREIIETMLRKLCYYGWNQTDCYKMMEKMKIVINQELIKLNVLILGESQLENVYKTINPSSGFSSNYVVLKNFHIKRMNMKYKISRYNSNIQSFKTHL